MVFQPAPANIGNSQTNQRKETIKNIKTYLIAHFQHNKVK